MKNITSDPLYMNLKLCTIVGNILLYIFYLMLVNSGVNQFKCVNRMHHHQECLLAWGVFYLNLSYAKDIVWSPKLSPQNSKLNL